LITNYNLLLFANEEEYGNPQTDRHFPVCKGSSQKQRNRVTPIYIIVQGLRFHFLPL